jgi:hypothetical protein
MQALAACLRRGEGRLAEGGDLLREAEGGLIFDLSLDLKSSPWIYSAQFALNLRIKRRLNLAPLH